MVPQIVSFLAAGDSIEDIMAEYPQITREDVQACLAYAAETNKERVLTTKSLLKPGRIRIHEFD